MKPSEKFSPYQRTTFLASVAPADRALATRLCEMLEAAFDVKDIAIYSGFPIVVRDMEWIAGFAMRKSGPIAYCCSPATLAELGAELKPYMSGKSCVAVKPRRGETIDVVLALIARAFKVASANGGMISKTDAKKREKLREAAGAAVAANAVGKKASAPRAATPVVAKKVAKKLAKKASKKTLRKTSKRTASKASQKTSSKPATNSAKGPARKSASR
ncbi:MAG: hypothetical protein RL591_158 [Planctomycetota bacterium]|jgi:hypothetical protein